MEELSVMYTYRYSRISKREPLELESGETTENACYRDKFVYMKKNCVWLLPPASC